MIIQRWNVTLKQALILIRKISAGAHASTHSKNTPNAHKHTCTHSYSCARTHAHDTSHSMTHTHVTHVTCTNPPSSSSRKLDASDMTCHFENSMVMCLQKCVLELVCTSVPFFVRRWGRRPCRDFRMDLTTIFPMLLPEEVESSLKYWTCWVVNWSQRVGVMTAMKWECKILRRMWDCSMDCRKRISGDVEESIVGRWYYWRLPRRMENRSGSSHEDATVNLVMEGRLGGGIVILMNVSRWKRKRWIS